MDYAQIYKINFFYLSLYIMSIYNDKWRSIYGEYYVLLEEPSPWYKHITSEIERDKYEESVITQSEPSISYFNYILTVILLFIFLLALRRLLRSVN